ncbi:hypothetical protein GYMLUDRAFT_251881 [Collybiopsis luxurians FD-317 M1]|uniref:HECT-type E3 ubiquitin transferase n=1 Tax=Collybiopsis luxurians FD-317 M1 TaxID=944289 RepID=A0A0D0CA27_9AGAR|nr:hypothetical protein GYMLUDRAFT_251881 [Collybiopsis luxurians FD-317 M1]
MEGTSLTSILGIPTASSTEAVATFTTVPESSTLSTLPITSTSAINLSTIASTSFTVSITSSTTPFTISITSSGHSKKSRTFRFTTPVTFTTSTPSTLSTSSISIASIISTNVTSITISATSPILSSSALSSMTFDSTETSSRSSSAPPHSVSPSPASSGNSSSQSPLSVSTGSEISTSPGVIVGSVVGSLIASITLGIVFLLLRRRRAHDSQNRLVLPSRVSLTRPSAVDMGHSRKKSNTKRDEKSEPHGTDSTAQPMEARLASMQNTVAQMIEHIQQLQAQLEYERGSVIEGLRSEAPPPTYASQNGTICAISSLSISSFLTEPSLFVSSKNIRLTVASANSLCKRHELGIPDPFALITVDAEQTHRTRAVSKTLNPCWNESFNMTVKKSSVVMIQVFDQKTLHQGDPPDLLGLVNVTISDICDFELGGDAILVLDLKKSNEKDSPIVQGKLNICLSLNVDESMSKSEPLQLPELSSALAGMSSELGSARTITSPVEIPAVLGIDLSSASPENEHLSESLPVGWEQCTDPLGRTYYVDYNARKSTWNRQLSDSEPASQSEHCSRITPLMDPATNTIINSASTALIEPSRMTVDQYRSLPASWEHCTTPLSRTYYINFNTKTTTWNRPSSKSEPASESGHSSRITPLVDPATNTVISSVSTTSIEPSMVTVDQYGPLPPGWEHHTTPLELAPESVQPVCRSVSSKSTHCQDSSFRITPSTNTVITSASTTLIEASRVIVDQYGPLPSGWEHRTDASGRIYYVNYNTKTTTWNRPSSASATRGERTSGIPPLADAATPVVVEPTSTMSTRTSSAEVEQCERLPPGWEQRTTFSGRT